MAGRIDVGKPILEVVWLDHWRDTEQTRTSDFSAKQRMQSVGYLIRETPTVLTISQTLISDPDEVQHTTHIEKALIQSRRVVEGGE
jgi:hypothetical protein